MISKERTPGALFLVLFGILHLLTPSIRSRLCYICHFPNPRSMKSIAFHFFCFAWVFLSSLDARTQTNTTSLTTDQFPEKAVWMNIEHKLLMENLNEKISIIVISDERCVECGYYLRLLEATTQKTPATQLLEVMVADSTNALSRKHLVN